MDFFKKGFSTMVKITTDFTFRPGTLNIRFLLVDYHLDDEPNLYMETSWKSPFPIQDKQFGFQVPGSQVVVSIGS